MIENAYLVLSIADLKSMLRDAKACAKLSGQSRDSACISINGIRVQKVANTGNPQISSCDVVLGAARERRKLEEAARNNKPEDFEHGMMKVLGEEIRRQKADGVSGMSADNLWQMVVSKISRLPGAPVGTNGAYYARQTFDKLVGRNPFVFRA